MTALVPHMSEASARASVERARTHLEAAAEEVVRQINGRAWIALGYESWDDMREAEYRGAAVIVPRADRPELVARLRAEGLSQKQIGDTIGVSQRQVSTDLSDVRNSSNVDLPATRVDSVGREQPTTYAPRAQDVPPASDAVERPANSAPLVPLPSPEAQQRYERDHAARVSREVASGNLARSIWFLGQQAEMDDRVERILTDWEPSQDIFPKPTTAQRIKAVADYLFELSERWPQ
jgi:hypothetical protein